MEQQEQNIEEVAQQNQSQQQQNPQKTCQSCKEEKQKLFTCTGCNKVQYCSKQCQKTDWKIHKTDCKFKKSEQKPEKKEKSLYQFTKEFDQMKIDGVKQYREQQVQALKQTFTERFSSMMKKNPIKIVYFEKNKEQEEDKTYGKILSLDTLEKIQGTYGQISEDELNQVEDSYRNQRRQALKDDDAQKYAQSIFGAFTDKDDILKTAQDVVIEYFELKLEIIEQSVKFFSKYGYGPQLQQIMQRTSIKQKEIVKPKNPVTEHKKIVEIFEFQQDLVENQRSKILNYINQLNMPPQQIQDILSQMIGSYLLDKTYLKFNVEEEDVNDYLKVDKNWNSELENLEKKINEGTFKIMNEFIAHKLKNMQRMG